jgi:hypothetical protein
MKMSIIFYIYNNAYTYTIQRVYGGRKKGIIYRIKIGTVSFINTHKPQMFIPISTFLETKETISPHDFHICYRYTQRGGELSRLFEEYI